VTQHGANEFASSPRTSTWGTPADLVSPLPAIASLLKTLATASLFAKQLGVPPAQGRFTSIDGLRGYLASFVFLHHPSIWYFYLRTGKWTVPPSILYAHVGQGSVSLVFMIIGFLFFSKLIDGRNRPIDWGRLFIFRFLRLVPLYLLLCFC
jgi:peptidoglycan/LPS O-acetylase OafA/YrhL